MIGSSVSERKLDSYFSLFFSMFTVGFGLIGSGAIKILFFADLKKNRP